MKYENAKEILPEALLKEVQKYAGGKLLYIPVENEAKNWGEVSGYRQKLLKRNVMIRNRYKSGVTLSELAEEYFLSLDSIKKIVYGKQEKELLFEPTTISAVRYANAGLLEEWMTMYYTALSEERSFSLEKLVCCGVRKVPLRLIEMGNVEEKRTVLGQKIAEEAFHEPLIVTYRNGNFFLEHQTELFLALKGQKINAYPTVILVGKEEYQQFEHRFGRLFIAVNQ